MSKEEEQNFFKLAYIVVNIVTDALRTVFKTEWDSKYPATPWLDDVASQNIFIAKEGKSSSNFKTKNMKRSGGKRETWDISVLTYALLESKPLDLQNTKPTLGAYIFQLKTIRNKVMHSERWAMNTTEFNNVYTGIENMMRNLVAQNGIYQTYLNQMIAIKNQTTQPTVDEFNIVRQALKNEKRKQLWQNIMFVTVVIVSCICVFTGLIKLYDIQEDVSSLRETLQPPSKHDLNLMKQFLDFAHSQNNYFILQVSGLFILGLCIAYLWLRLHVMEKNLLPWNIVPDFGNRLEPAFFQGRSSVIRETVNSIWNGAVITMFTGQPGIGKTATSVVVAKDLRDNYNFTVSLVEVRGMIDISRVTEKIFKAFCGEYRDFNDDAFDDLFRHRLQEKTLLIIDNAEDILTKDLIRETKKLLLRIVAYNTNVHILLTSRKQIDSLGDYDVTVKRLDVLDQDTSYKVLSSPYMCPILSEESFMDSAYEIARRCCGVPLLLSIAGKQLKHDIRHAKSSIRQREIIDDFLEELRKDSVLVTLNDDNEIDERSMMHCLDILFSRIDIDLQKTFIALSVFQVSFSDKAAGIVIPGSVAKIPCLLDFNILNDIYMSVDAEKERYSMHPLLQEYALSKLGSNDEVLTMVKNTEERFYSFFIHEIKLITDRFFSTTPGTALVAFSEDDSNFRKTLLNALTISSLFESFYDMLLSAADLFMFGFDDKLVSSFFDYAAEDAKQRKDVPRYLALLFLQGDRGDVFFYHHKDKYNKIQKLVDAEVDMIVNTTLTLNKQSTRETAYALCIQGRVLALYPSRAGWTKDAEKVDNFEKGKSLVESAIGLLDDLGLQHDKAIVLSLLGLILKNKRLYNDAIKSYKKALDILTTLYKNHALIGAMHFNIGYMHYKLGRENFLDGTKEFLKSFDVYEKTLGDHKRTASAMFHAGECLNMYGQLEESLPYFVDAFKIQERVAPRDRDIAETLMSIAEVNYKLGKYKTALPYFEKCLKVMTYKGVMSHPKHREIGYAYKGLANCLMKMNCLDDAKINFNIALDIFIFVFAEHNRCKEEIDDIRITLSEI